MASCCEMWCVIKTSCIVLYTEFIFTNKSFLFVWNQLILRAECLLLNDQPATISENDADWFWKSAKDAIVRWGALRKDAKQGQINCMQALELQIRVMYASYHTGAWGTWYDAHGWVMSHCFLTIGEQSFSLFKVRTINAKQKYSQLQQDTWPFATWGMDELSGPRTCIAGLRVKPEREREMEGGRGRERAREIGRERERERERSGSGFWALDVYRWLVRDTCNCSVLQCVAVCCSVVRWASLISTWHLWPQCVAVCLCCSELQCVVMCCIALQRVAVFCSVL